MFIYGYKANLVFICFSMVFIGFRQKPFVFVNKQRKPLKNTENK